MNTYSALASLYDRWAETDYVHWVDFYEALFAHFEVKPRTIADLCCGTGKGMLELLKRGYKVTGVDISEDMLEQAGTRLRKGGFASAMLVCQDITRLKLPPQDACVCMCDGFNYLLNEKQVLAALRGIHAALRPNGILIFDISTYYKLKYMEGNGFFGKEDIDAAYLWQNRFDDSTHTIDMDITFWAAQASQQDDMHRTRELHRQRAHTQHEMEQWLAQAGFELQGIFGDLRLEPPKPKEMRIHFVAKRS